MPKAERRQNPDYRIAELEAEVERLRAENETANMRRDDFRKMYEDLSLTKEEQALHDRRTAFLSSHGYGPYTKTSDTFTDAEGNHFIASYPVANAVWERFQLFVDREREASMERDALYASLRRIEEAAREVLGTINNGVMPNESATALRAALEEMP